MPLDEQVRAVLTLELEPSTWACEGYQDWLRTPGWGEFWQDSLAKHDLQPIHFGSWQVEITEFRQDAVLWLAALRGLERRGIVGFPDVQGRQDGDEADRVGALPGGCFLFVDDELMAEADCCHDLADLEAWQSLLALQPGEEGEVIIGHGGWHALREGDEFLVSNDDARGVEEFRVERSALANALAAASDQLSDFSDRLGRTLDDRLEDPQRARLLARLLTGRPSVDQ